MFFAIDLLIPQHGGKFSIAWIAATRGIRYIDKKQIVQCDIAKLCDEIEKMVQSSSSRPRLRLSLSLASRLINGVTKVYKRQVEIALDDFQAFFFHVRVPHIDASLSQEGTATPPVPKVRGKRKRKVLQLSDEPVGAAIVPTAAREEFLDPIIIDEAELARPPAFLQHANLITLREELPSRPPGEEIDEGFGVLEEGEAPEYPIFEPEVAAPVKSIAAPSTPEKRKATTAVETPTKRRLFAQIPPIEETAENEISEVPPQVDVQTVPVIPEIVEPVSQDGTEVEAMSQHPVVAQLENQPEARIPPKRNWRTKTDIRTRRIRVVHINRCEVDARERLNLSSDKDRIPIEVEVTDQEIDEGILKFLAVFLEESEPPAEVEKRIEELRNSRNMDSLFRPSSSSLPHLRSRLTLATPKGSTPVVPLVSTTEPDDVPPAQQALDMVPILEEHILPDEQMIEPEIPMDVDRVEVPYITEKPLVENTGISVSQLDMGVSLAPPDRTIETEIPPVAEIAHVKRPELGGTSAETKKLLTKDRQKGIRNIVANWNADRQGDCVIEDVCKKPINRMNIAVAFNDLLSLHKMGYVALTNKPDSLELGSIEKGPLINRKK